MSGQLMGLINVKDLQRRREVLRAGLCTRQGE